MARLKRETLQGRFKAFPWSLAYLLWLHPTIPRLESWSVLCLNQLLCLSSILCLNHDCLRAGYALNIYFALEGEGFSWHGIIVLRYMRTENYTGMLEMRKMNTIEHKLEIRRM